MVFSARPLFAGVSFVINPRERIALVGKNGAGKSTLLKILAGKEQATSGSVSLPKDITVGYLPQVMKLSDELSVRQETEKAFSHLHDLEREIAHLNDALSERTDYDSEEYMQLVETFTHESERYQMMGGSDCQALLERTLQGLGFQRDDFERPTKEFSGGWRMRIELAKILLQAPDLLLLDEPTNHLDIESIAWLEQFLAHSGSAVVLVSHDRAFINAVTSRTMEISVGKLTDYKVAYDEYVQLRAERRAQQLRAYENQQKEIADIKAFVERFRYKPTKAVQVQSRLKQLEKIVPIEIDDVDSNALRLKFPPCSRSGDYPVICEDLSKFYGSHCVIEHVNFTLKRGEKVAFVGKNGEGKSTFVKCIMQELEHNGSLKLGHNVQIGYYAQNQAQLLDENISVYDTIERVATGDIRTRIPDILGAFMFGGELSEKKVKVLSGGERSRLAMIRLLLEPVNFLILDEPTNHLDLRTKDVLKEAVKAFDGTVIVVSHDRDFLDGLVSKVYEFGGGRVREHIGNIYEFLKTKQIAHLDALYTCGSPIKIVPSIGIENTAGKIDYAQQKEYARQRRLIEKRVAVAEAEVIRLESLLLEKETALSTPDGASDSALAQAYGELQKAIEQATIGWNDAVQELESFNKQFN